ncbi:MAG: sporulation protein YqfD [Lachnospiraceae bacterium]
MIGILKYIRGYVEIKAWGFAPERFLNLCSNKNILLWNIRRDGDIYYMCISLAGFRRLKSIARKTKTRVVILKRYGLPFLIPKVFARKVFIAGLFAACFFWVWSSLYVWEIQIEGNYSITEDVFLDFLEDEGIHVGIRSRSIDIEELEKDIRREFAEITWTSAKLSGTRLIISMKENDAVLSPVQEQDSCDLYAEKDGTIVSMIVRSGVSKVQIGDTVQMGSLLISGEVPVYNEDGTVRKFQYTRADADIYVERTQAVYEVLPFYYIKKVYTGREEKRYWLEVFGKEFLFGREADFTDFDVVISKQQLTPLKGFTLPISFGTRNYREYQNTECSYTLTEAENLLNEKYSEFFAGLEEKGVQIIEKNVKIDTGSGIWILQGELKVKEKIGAEVPIKEMETENPPVAEITGAE